MIRRTNLRVSNIAQNNKDCAINIINKNILDCKLLKINNIQIK